MIFFHRWLDKCKRRKRQRWTFKFITIHLTFLNFKASLVTVSPYLPTPLQSSLWHSAHENQCETHPLKKCNLYFCCSKRNQKEKNKHRQSKLLLIKNKEKSWTDLGLKSKFYCQLILHWYATFSSKLLKLEKWPQTLCFSFYYNFFVENLSYFHFTDYFINTCLAFFLVLSDTISAFVTLPVCPTLKSCSFNIVPFFRQCTTKIMNFLIKNIFGNVNPWLQYSKGIFRTLSNTYDGPFLQK